METTPDWIKALILMALYGVVAPLWGFCLRRRRSWQKAAFAILCFMMLGGFLQAAEWGLTLDNHLYRGHARGYHFYFAEVPALALIVGRILENWRTFKPLPPGLGWYLFFCAMSFVSIVNAPAPSYALMAAFKAVKVALIFVAAYHFFEREADVHFFLKVMALVMAWELIAALKMKYLDGVYQVPGTFEHQNSLSMFATMIGMVFLAASFGPKESVSNSYLMGFVACSVIEQATLSRAGLAVYAAGGVGICALSLIDQIVRRRIWVLTALALIGVAGVAKSMNTIVNRFHDTGNEASAETRVLLNEASRRMAQDYPLGIGWNNFALVINKPFPYGKVIDDWQRAGGATVDENAPKGIVESLYYLILAETGWQSLAAFILFVAVFLWRNIRGAWQFRRTFLGAVSLGIGAGCFCNYLQSWFERILIQPRNLMFWMILLALTAKIELWRRAARAETTPPDLRTGAGVFRAGRRLSPAAGRPQPMPALGDGPAQRPVQSG